MSINIDIYMYIHVFIPTLYKYRYMYFINSCMFIVLKRAIKGKNIWVLISKGVVKKIEAYTVDHDQPLQYHNG